MTPETTQDSVLAVAAAGGEGPAQRPTYWRHFSEYDRGEQVDEFVHREFPSQVNELLDPVSRRNFFKVMGASMMLAGLAGCARQPEEKIVPYVKPPEEAIPGKPQYYATAATLGGYAIGLVATSYEGRPTKVEGLREHASSLGKTDSWAQASVLDMYDPDRLDAINYAGQISTWARFVQEVSAKVASLDAAAGAGIAILTETNTSPTLAWQIGKLQAQYPGAKWYQWDGLGTDNTRRGAQLAFGEYVDTIYDFSKTKVVLSLDADFLSEGPGRVRYSADFAKARDYDANGGSMARLYVAESSPTLTGSTADHTLTLRFPHVETVARAVAEKLGVPGVSPHDIKQHAIPEAWLNALVADLGAAQGAAVVVAGEQQPAIVHAIAHAINEKLGAVASGVVKYIEPVEQNPVIQLDSITELAGEMTKGNVKLLVILGGNPAYSTPHDLNFAEAIEKVDLRVHLTESTNETSDLVHWVVPAAHYLEGWSDARGHDGTVSIVQPLIQPLYNGKTSHEVLAVLLGNDTATAYDLIRESWTAQRGPEGFENFWRDSLGAGYVADSAARPKRVQHKLQFAAQELVKEEGLDVVFRLDASALDGRATNNSWLQELPRPLTRLTWDNAIIVHPDTARANKLKHEDVAELTVGNKTVTGPVLIQFGHPKNVVTVHLGYGRKQCGVVGKGVGFDANAIRSAKSPWFTTGGVLSGTGKTYLLSRTEEHWNIEQSLAEQAEAAERRHLIRETSLTNYEHNKEFAKQMGHPAPSPEFTLYDPVEKDFNVDHKWAMTIDLNKCTGCGVCTIACQSENNIPVVGKDQVRNGREMHWIRIDRYYKGDLATGEIETVHQPVPCMQCENAPCEPVCPVGATMHSQEGLNDMVYNRCIGTRYCANNCPYKVRRFNFFKFADHTTPQLKMMRNPNVTVRSRGVMEKCTYCVQRINIARIDAKREGRVIADGEVVAACQQACPSEAITFGNMKDPESKVAKAIANPRNYALIGDIGTRPRTTYLAKLRNYSPALAKQEAPAEGHH